PPPPYAPLYNSYSSPIQPTTTSTLFPYTTLFRSQLVIRANVLNQLELDAEDGAVALGGDFVEIHVAAAMNGAGEILAARFNPLRSEEHTSELQSRGHLVCRLLLRKKKPEQARSRH